MGEIQWLNEKEERTWRALQFMQMRLAAQLGRDLALHSDLTYQDYVVLVALTDEPDKQKRLFELAEKLGWERSRLSHHVSRMEKRGLVSKEKCDSDHRGAFVVITDAGSEEITIAAPSHANAVRRLFIDQLTPTQIKLIGEVAEKILENLKKEDGYG